MTDQLRKAAQDALEWMDARGESVYSVGGMNLVNSMNEIMQALRAALAQEQQHDSSIESLIESLIGEYWDVAYQEGKTGVSQGDAANEVLSRIRKYLRAWRATAQPAQQEPVAWIHRQGYYAEPSNRPLDEGELSRGWTQEPLYTRPPAKDWVGLTDEEIDLQIAESMNCYSTHQKFARAIEAKLKELNHG